MTRPRFAVIEWRTSAGAASSARSAISEERFHLIEDRNRDLVLRSLREHTVSGDGHECDGVVGSVEPDARLRDVVEDEKVGALAFELRACAVDAALARLRGEADDDLACPP